MSYSNQPNVILSQRHLEFKALKFGERLTQTIIVSNPVPETTLQGRWEVSLHPNDPPQIKGSHGWISIQPANFVGNKVKCKITVDTSKLMENEVYDRQLLLYINPAYETEVLIAKAAWLETAKAEEKPIPLPRYRPAIYQVVT